MDFEVDQTNEFEEIAFEIFVKGSNLQSNPKLKKVAANAANKLPSFKGGVGYFLAYQALDAHSLFVKGEIKDVCDFLLMNETILILRLFNFISSHNAKN
jgi:hypothetical protein